MTTNRDQAYREQLVFRYLYGDLNEQELQRFARELAEDPALQSLLESEQALDAMIPRGSQPQISDARLQQNRAQALHRAFPHGETARGGLLATLRHPLWLSGQLAALVLAFLLGNQTGGQDDGTQVAATSASPLNLVRDDDYEIYSMQVNSYDAQSGRIDLSFSLASESRFVGNVADAQVRMLIDAALRNDIKDEDRLDAVEVLKYAAQKGPGIDPHEGLIYALNSDSNPGVRYSAASSLAPLASQENVRAALREALNEDTNPGVRLVAFDALADRPDANTLAVFRQRMTNDDNAYIRDRSRSIVEQFEQDGSQPGRF